ncbi:hypothetical protein M3Y95_00851500 [Aphelenchoides besseyi]|nr:hypothetical protein M3Y95_00851500 [Aphelenchoides besseyi]
MLELKSEAVANTPSCSSSTSSNSPTRDSSPSNANVIRCPVCGGPAFNKHFGIPSCNSCAAFFRRTVGMKQRHVCAHDKTCHIRISEGRNICKFCRWHRCISNGMIVNSVCSSRVSEMSDTSELWRITMAQRATFVNRFNAIIKAYGTSEGVSPVGYENPAFSHTITAMRAEISVLVDYMRASGFNNLGLSVIEFTHLTRALFYPWCTFQCLMNTLRNQGHKSKTAFGTDESHMLIDNGVIRRYVETCEGLLDYGMVAKYTKKCFTDCLHAVELIHNLKMEDTEHSALYQIFALSTAARMFPTNKEIRARLNQLFALLKSHYQEGQNDLPIRLGNMVLLLSELEALTNFFGEYVQILYVNGYNSIAAQMGGSNL